MPASRAALGRQLLFQVLVLVLQTLDPTLQAVILTLHAAVLAVHVFVARQFVTQSRDLSVLLLDDNVPRILLRRTFVQNGADAAQQAHAPFLSARRTKTFTPTRGFPAGDPVNEDPHGSRVYWPEEEGVRKALGIDDYHRNTPAGYITMSGPNDNSIVISVDMDADYLIGPEGAHLNISGISGLATKTSYAMFILSAIQQRAKDWSGGSRPAFVVLNVKGSDLLHLHEPDPNLNDHTRGEWKRCGLQCAPLSDVTYFYPYSAKDPARTQTMLSAEDVSANVDAGRGYRYFYDVENALERLHLLFEDMDDPAQTLVSCVEYCREHLRAESPWSALRSSVADWANTTPDKNRIPVVSWRRFHRLFGQRTRNGMFTELARQAADYRQAPLSDSLRRLQPGHVAVVDIAQLPDYLQAFVVGDVISILRDPLAPDPDDEEEETSSHRRPVVLFADELNKFAPKHGGARSLTGHLREISERGRSEGIILFGAEQFRTSVDDRVTGNSGTHVFGRTTAVESQKDAEIRLRPQSRRVPFLRKGELLVSHTRFSAGTLKLRFPRNAYRPR